MPKLLNGRSLMQPFLPGSPGGRGQNGHGASKRVADDRWATAFPECKHNDNLGGEEKPWSYEEYLKKKALQSQCPPAEQQLSESPLVKADAEILNA